MTSTKNTRLVLRTTDRALAHIIGRRTAAISGFAFSIEFNASRNFWQVTFQGENATEKQRKACRLIARGLKLLYSVNGWVKD